MTKILDGFGKPCPMPLVMAKKEIDAGCHDLAIQVDNETAVKNLTRLGEKANLSVARDAIEGGWLVTFSEANASQGENAATASGLEGATRPGAAEMVATSAMRAAIAAQTSLASAPAQTASGQSCSAGVGCGYAVFIGKDYIGEGDRELGQNLMKMALYTLSENSSVPASLLLMNAGVRLVASGNKQAEDSIRALEAKGTEVLVCGTCLDFYGLKDSLAVGEVSNMYDILERMQEAAKVITL